MKREDYEKEFEKEKLEIPEELSKQAKIRKIMQDLVDNHLDDLPEFPDNNLEQALKAYEDLGKAITKKLVEQAPRRVEVINQRDVQKIEVTNQKDVQKVEITNQQQAPEVQKVSLVEKIVTQIVKFPTIQKIVGSVSVDNLPKVQKVSVDNPVEKVEVSGLEKLLQSRQLPTGSTDNQGNLQKESSAPNRFLNVRLTDGKKFLGEMFTSAFSTAQRIFANEAGEPATATVGNDGSVWVNLKAGTITGADGAILDGVSSSIKATVLDTTEEAVPGAANPQLVRPVGTTAISGSLTTTIDEPLNVDGQVSISGTVATTASVSIDEPLTVDGQVSISGTTTTSGVMLQAVLDRLFDTLTVDGSGVTQPVSGTFWQVTQPISAASLPLPTSAATSAKQLADGHNVTIPQPSTVDGQVSISGTTTISGVITREPVSTSLIHGQQRITVSGTAVTLSGISTDMTWMILTALPENVANIYLGDSDVSLTNGSVMQPGQSTGMQLDDASKIYIVGSIANDGISYHGGN